MNSHSLPGITITENLSIYHTSPPCLKRPRKACSSYGHLGSMEKRFLVNFYGGAIEIILTLFCERLLSLLHTDPYVRFTRSSVF